MSDKLHLLGGPRGPEARRVMAEAQREFMASYGALMKKHGRVRCELAFAKFNFETIYEQLRERGNDDMMLAAVRKVFEHALTCWGTLAQIDQSEIQPIVEGLRTQTGIAVADITNASKGEQDAPPR